MVIKMPQSDEESQSLNISHFCSSDPEEILYPQKESRPPSNEDKITLENPVDFLTRLPPELALKILEYLDISSLIQASRTCKRWHNIISNTEWLWSHVCQRFCEFRSDMEDDRQKGYSWKETFYRNCHHHKIRRQWLNGQFSNICRIEDKPDNFITVFDGDTWGDIFEAELNR